VAWHVATRPHPLNRKLNQLAKTCPALQFRIRSDMGGLAIERDGQS
jgi:hypothetical protein